MNVKNVIKCVVCFASLLSVLSCRKNEFNFKNYYPAGSGIEESLSQEDKKGELHCVVMLKGLTEEDIINWYMDKGFQINTNNQFYHGYNRTGTRFSLARDGKNKLELWHFKDD